MVYYNKNKKNNKIKKRKKEIHKKIIGYLDYKEWTNTIYNKNNYDGKETNKLINNYKNLLEKEREKQKYREKYYYNTYNTNNYNDNITNEKIKQNNIENITRLMIEREKQKNMKSNIENITKDIIDNYIKNVNYTFERKYQDKSQKQINELINNKDYLQYNPKLYNNSLYNNDFFQSHREKIQIQREIKNLNDLIQLIDEYPPSPYKEYNINMNALYKIKPSLIKLQNMIGMEKLKNAIVDQIIYFIQGLHNTEGDFMHSCIYGPPGTGKTEIAKIMGEIFSNLGILKSGSFTKVVRSDLIAGYLGQTALKTKEVINKSLGGVLFIDEAYALGNPEKKDSFSKECIDTLCEALSNHKHELMVIIAGYEDDLKKCFFSYNKGLDSRFTWRFKTDNYNPEELRDIFCKKIKDAEWSIDEKFKDDFSLKWFERNIDYFTFYGRDMETLFSKVKIAHSRRVFCLDKNMKKKINKTDMEKGFLLYLDNDEVKNRKEKKIPAFVAYMYN